ncbi:hypothetical protein [Marinobacterium rhizophilum]|uniref:Lipoprotein n=1 Tax=Marinobacterium rhizophilum TaxID=420402 RepID=A0ABY5HJD7_9GAMM|nr:hypothetical protein [Marinobacterium rhizophilum]UTW12493.1 hypothetical protein KDW95_02065 [Marinobacterium rhizophilum]
MRILRAGRACLLVALAFVAGCALQPRPGADNEQLFYRGEVSPDGDRWVIQPCYSRRRQVLSDPLGLLAERYQAQAVLPGLPLYMELRASTAGEVGNLLLVGGDSRACAAELDGIRLRAAGFAPDWAADLSGDRLDVRDQSRRMRFIFSVTQTSSRRGDLRWEGRLQTPDGKARDVDLRLRESGCEDASGVWYGLSVNMRLDGRNYQGCGRYGDLTRTALAGRYSRVLVSGEGPARTTVLELSAEGAASLSEDYHDGAEPVRRDGSWRWMPTGKLMLHLMQRDGESEQQLRLFRRQPDGTLVLEGRVPEYGVVGLRLSPD